MIELSNLDAVDLQEVWPHEAHDFTPWLAQHLDLLGDALGLQLELQGAEMAIGPFSLDVLARDVGNDRPVVIENQLKATDHDHLGKLLTYAAGYDANIVVWLVQEFRAEHRAALDWLNQRTGEETAFFGVVVEAWRIADSPPAPRFNAVVVPNDWQKQVASSGQGSEVSETKERQRAFFQTLIDVLREEHTFTQARVGQPQNWYHFASGFTGMSYGASFAWQDRARVELYIGKTGDQSGNKWLFDQLEQHKEPIEAALGYELTWERLDLQVASRISVDRNGSIADSPETLEDIRQWMIEHLLRFQDAFGPHLDELLS